MASDQMPAIRRRWTAADSNADVLGVVRDKTRFIRGLGSSGRTVERVRLRAEHELPDSQDELNGCPSCSHEYMIRSVSVNPESRDDVEYYCLNPQCRYFVNGALSWATRSHPQYEADTPAVWDQTHVCVGCGDRETITIDRAQYDHARDAEMIDDGIIEHLCSECEDSESSRSESSDGGSE